jgi:hypothetical protein
MKATDKEVYVPSASPAMVKHFWFWQILFNVIAILTIFLLVLIIIKGTFLNAVKIHSLKSFDDQLF